MPESKVVYRDGEQVRAIRGTVEDHNDEYFIEVHRRDGIVKIARNSVIKIEVGI